MRLGLYVPAALILLADTLPGAVSPREPTHYRIALGFGAAEYEEKSFNCDGDLTGALPVDLVSAGGRVDLLNGSVRISVFGGMIDVTEGNPEYDGGYGGVQFASEGEHFGYGAGVAAVFGDDQLEGTNEEALWAPSIYLRVGAREGWHGRLDVFPPSENLGAVPWARLGAEYGRGVEPGFGGALGIGIAPYTYGEQFEPRVFGELDVPLGPRPAIYLLLRGQMGAGENRSQWGASAGLRWDIGGPWSPP